MEDKNFELRNIKFVPIIADSTTDIFRLDRGLESLKGSLGYHAGYGFEFNYTVQYEVSGGSQVKVTNVEPPQTGVTFGVWRFELDNADNEFLKRFSVGNEIHIDYQANTLRYRGIITFVSSSVIELDLGTFPQSGTGLFVEGRYGENGELLLFRNVSDLERVEIDYNFTPSSDNTFSNLWDGGTQGYIGVPRGTNRVNLELNSRTSNWVSSFSRFVPIMEYNGQSNDQQIATEIPERECVKNFQLRQLPLIQPYWNERYENNYDESTLPNEYKGDGTLNLYFKLRLYVSTSSNVEPIEILYTIEGDIGWLNEDGNGGLSDFKTDSVSYLNVDRGRPVNGLAVSEITRNEVRISRETGVFSNSDIVQVTLFRQTPFEDYNEQKTVNNLTYSTSYAIKPLNNSGTTRLYGGKELTQLVPQIISGGKGLKLEFNHQSKPSTLNRINENDSYILLVSVYSPNGGQYITIQADNTSYTLDTDEDGLVLLSGARVFDPDFDINESNWKDLNRGYSSGQFWNEDGLTAYWKLGQGNSTYGTIQSLKFQLNATRISAKDGYNDYSDPENYVLIKEYDIPFEIARESTRLNPPLYSGSDTRPFNLDDDDFFKRVIVESNDFGGGFADTHVLTSFKVNWQDWVQLENVPTDFFDQSQNNNGYNQKTSNYSDKPINDEFIVNAVLIVECQNRENEFTTDYAFELPLEVYDYGEDKKTREGATADFAGTITTSKEDGTDLNGNVLFTEDTFLKVHWVNSGQEIGNVYWFMLRIEEEFQPFYDNFELSTLRNPLLNSPLQPINGFTNLKVTDDGNDGYFVECRIDHTKLVEGLGYRLSARMGLNEDGVGVDRGFTLGFTTGFNA